jgi:acyl-homoserine-lactone acylase
MRKSRGAGVVGFIAVLAIGTAVPALAAAPAPDVARLKAEAARVTITRDSWGIAHVRGRTDADAVFGAIYAQAEDDFGRIEANYLTALGRTAEAADARPDAIWADLRQRLYVDPDDLKARYAASPAWLRTLMDHWADGLNLYLATHPGVHPKVLTRFEPWMALSFTEGSIGGDIERIDLQGLAAFYGGETALARKTQETAQAGDALRYREPTGSNGMAVAPQNTRAGHALLLINPHTSFYFRSELQMASDEGLDAYGASTWGQFFIYQGFNAHAGWMHTSSGVDSVDEFAETVSGAPDSGRATYRVGGQDKPLLSKIVTLRQRTASGALAERRFTVFRTEHGPVVRQEGDRLIAVSMMYRPVEALSQSFLRTKATDYAAFTAVADRYKANSSNNTLFADDRGEIAYLHPQFIPLRDDRFDWRRPVDGSDPAAAWKGDTPFADTPHLKNPPAGFVYNSNDQPWLAAGAGSLNPAAFPRYMDQAGWNPRSDHALRVLSGRRDFTLDGLRAAAYDSWLPEFARLIPPLLAAYDALPADDPQRARLAAPIAALRGWDVRWGADSVPTSVAVFYGEALWAQAAPVARRERRSPYAVMEEAAPPAARLAALGAAVDRLAADYGRWDTPWGAINRYQRLDDAITPHFDDAKPSIPVPFTSAQWGSLASFGLAASPTTKKRYGNSGNSFVAVVEFGPRVRALAVTAGGESGDPASPHFTDQASRYVSGALREVWFHPDQVQAHAVRAYHPGA